MKMKLALTVVTATFGLLTIGVADATNYYVDQSCSTSGNGTADQCASSAAGPGAFMGVQSCFDAVRAGDTCNIKNGTYISNNTGTTPRYNGGFTLAHSGTANAPIIVRNYPGHRPLLANCTPGQTSYCDHPTITTPEQSYIVFDGLRVEGGIWMFGVDINNPVTGNVIKNTEITTGWGGVADGNWAGIFLQDQSHFLIQNNYIHDIFVQTGGGQQSSGTCIKMYQTADSIVEYNTCRHVPIADSQAGGIDDKAQAVRNIHRRNWIEDVPTGIRINNQLNSTGVQVYDNVIISRDIGIKLLIDIDGIDVYNNTIANCTDGLVIANTMQNVRFYNNIVTRATDNNLTWYANNPTYSNYNAFSSSAAAPAYRDASVWYYTLAAYQSATGLDTASAELDCGFAAASTDFHLSSTSPCHNAGRVGGVAGGQPVDLGAYANVACVGYGCISGGDRLPPAAPTNLTVQ
jgi:hypothetical protein